MPNPELIELPKDVWTKVATLVTTGQIKKKKPDQVVYLSTHRITGDPAPDNIDDKEEGIEIFVDTPNSEEIRNSTAIDVYVMPIGVDAQVRMDL